MPLDLSDTLVIGISATALFDMTESDSVFRDEFAKNPEKAVQNYRAYMLERENEPLSDGTGMPLVRALLALNKYQKMPQSMDLASSDRIFIYPVESYGFL